jgi:hypothetical protein
MLNAARKAVPAVNYALGLVGIGAAAAIIVGLVGYSRGAIILFALMLVGMVLLFVISRLFKSRSRWVYGAAHTLLWGIILVFIAFIILSLSAVSFRYPCPLAMALGVTESCSPVDEGKLQFNGTKGELVEILTERTRSIARVFNDMISTLEGAEAGFPPLDAKKPYKPLSEEQRLAASQAVKILKSYFVTFITAHETHIEKMEADQPALARVQSVVATQALMGAYKAEIPKIDYPLPPFFDPDSLNSKYCIGVFTSTSLLPREFC